MNAERARDTRADRRYEFDTTWRLRAPIEAVWNAIFDAERYPEWWPGVERVISLKAGKTNGVGRIVQMTWKGPLPYQLVLISRTTRVQSPFDLVGVVRGSLVGEGRSYLSEDSGVTTVRYYWDVSTTEWWMNLLAPFAGPIFHWNHDYIMRQGGEGLARRLGVELLDIEEHAGG